MKIRYFGRDDLGRIPGTDQLTELVTCRPRTSNPGWIRFKCELRDRVSSSAEGDPDLMTAEVEVEVEVAAVLAVAATVEVDLRTAGKALGRRTGISVEETAAGRRPAAYRRSPARRSDADAAGRHLRCPA